MKFDHLSVSQLSYLQGMVEKCADHGVDPRIVFKVAENEFSKGWGEITKGISETGPMKWLASGDADSVGNQQQFAASGKHDPFSGIPESHDWRGLVHKSIQPGNKLNPQDASTAEYYQKMMAHPTFQAAAKADYGPKGLARIGRGIYDFIMPGSDIRKTRYGVEEQAAARQAEERLREKYMQSHPIPQNAGSTPGGRYTPMYSNTYVPDAPQYPLYRQ